MHSYKGFTRHTYTNRALDTVMSDSEDSTITYMAVSSPFEDGLDIGSPGVGGPPIIPEDLYAYIMAAYQVLPSPDYIPGPEEPQLPPPLEFVPEPMYPEYIPKKDEILLDEEQTLPAAASPTADPPGYVPKSDPKKEPEEDDEDPEEDPADYSDDKDDDDGYDEDEDEDEEEEEEHLALADSVPPIHSSVLPASPPASPIRLLGYRAAMIWLRAKTPSTSQPLLLPTSSPPLRLLSSDHRTDRPEITLPPRKRLGIDLGLRYEIGESSTAAATRSSRGHRVDYGFVSTIDTKIRRQRAEEEQDTQDIYVVIGDTQDRQTKIYQSVKTLFDDKVSYMTRSGIMALRSVVIGQQAVISQLQAADRKSRVVTSEMLQAYHQRQVQLTKALKLLKGLQTQMVEFQRQHGPVKGPAQPDVPGEAGSSS
ncbi:hypothetical protein Tco_0833576 [Tanacetum coccineum]